jgi:hypothetical protein
MTGKTVEQFIYNNYYNTTEEIYKSNYPWLVDIDMAFVETIMYLIIIAASGVIIILTFNIVKQKKIKR